MGVLGRLTIHKGVENSHVRTVQNVEETPFKRKEGIVWVVKRLPLYCIRINNGTVSPLCHLCLGLSSEISERSFFYHDHIERCDLPFSLVRSNIIPLHPGTLPRVPNFSDPSVLVVLVGGCTGVGYMVSGSNGVCPEVEKHII